MKKDGNSKYTNNSAGITNINDDKLLMVWTLTLHCFALNNKMVRISFNTHKLSTSFKFPKESQYDDALWDA